MALDDAAHQCEPEPGALALGLGGEERIEDAAQDLRRNPGTAVRDLDPHESVRCLVAGHQTQPPGRRCVLDRLARVRDEVHHDLLQLVSVGPDQRQALLGVEFHLDVGDAKLEGQKLHGVAQEVIQRHVAALGRMAPGHRQEAPDDPYAALRGLPDVLDPRAGDGIAAGGGEQPDLSENDRERAVELVRDAREQVPHRRQLFGLEQLMRALLDLPLQRLVLAPEVAVQEAHLDEIAHAQQELGLLEGLRDEVAGSGLERRALALAGHVGGQDQHRQIELGPALLEPLENLDAVEQGHAEVQHDEVGKEVVAALDDRAGVGDAEEIGVAGVRQQLLEEPHHRRLVVHDQDPGTAERLWDHVTSRGLGQH